MQVVEESLGRAGHIGGYPEAQWGMCAYMNNFSNGKNHNFVIENRSQGVYNRTFCHNPAKHKFS